MSKKSAEECEQTSDELSNPFRRDKEESVVDQTPKSPKLQYIDIQKGGDIPFTGLRKPAPATPPPRGKAAVIATRLCLADFQTWSLTLNDIFSFLSIELAMIWLKRSVVCSNYVLISLTGVIAHQSIVATALRSWHLYIPTPAALLPSVHPLLTTASRQSVNALLIGPLHPVFVPNNLDPSSFDAKSNSPIKIQMSDLLKLKRGKTDELSFNQKSAWSRNYLHNHNKFEQLVGKSSQAHKEGGAPRVIETYISQPLLRASSLLPVPHHKSTRVSFLKQISESKPATEEENFRPKFYYSSTIVTKTSKSPSSLPRRTLSRKQYTISRQPPIRPPPPSVTDEQRENVPETGY